MASKGRLLLFIGLAAIFMGLLTIPGSIVRATEFPGFLSGPQQAQSDLTVDLWISPEAGRPGDQLFLNIRLSAGNNAITAAELEIFLPGSLSLDLVTLPAGTSYNIQANSLIWHPLLANAEDQVLLTIPLTVSSVDLSAPEQMIHVMVKNGLVESNYSTPVWVGVPPQASIRFGPPQAAIGQAVQLIGDTSGPGPFTQIWDLGDGRTVAVNDPEVIYSTPGVYQVSLRVSNPIATTIATAQLVVGAQPIARISIPDTSPAVGDTVIFLNQSGGQEPLNFSWDFGDGTGSNEPNPTHQYATAGTYQVHLTISNDLGQSDSYQELFVGQRPTADIVADDTPDAGRLFEVQAFHDGSITNIHWDMGDGHYYEGERINHVYWSAGDYLISATFSNEYGETVIQKWIRVEPGKLYLYIPIITRGGDSQSVSILSPIGDDQATTVTSEAIASEEAKQLLALEVDGGMLPAEQLFAYINEARRINNLAPLQNVFELNVAAQTHADDMATFGSISHEGSDGSSPALRIQRSSYPGGYAGEATAWGMQSAIDPVQFWLTSPEHRVILLNPSATDVGVGYNMNYGAPSVWYWTAEFASMNLAPIRVLDPQAVPETLAVEEPASIQLLGPPQDSDFLLSNENFLIFTWSWPEPLLNDQKFAVYLSSQGRIYQIGNVREVQSGTQYQFKVLASNVPVAPGSHQWVVRLEDNLQGELLAESAYWPISFRLP